MSDVRELMPMRPMPLGQSSTGQPQRHTVPEWWRSLEGFETEEETRREDLLRVDAANLVGLGMFYCEEREGRITRISGFDAADIADLTQALETPSIELRQGSLASRVCMRAVRQEGLQSVFDAFAPYRDHELATATVIKSPWIVNPEELMALSAATIKHQFVCDLWRAGVASFPGPLIAFMHGEFEPTLGVFVLHWHVLSTSEKAKALHRLKGTGETRSQVYVTTPTGADPIVVKPINDRTRQVSYLLKSFWPQKAVRDGKRDRDPHRVDEPYHTLHLAWLNRQALKDITVMNRVWSRRAGGTETMKRMYFKFLG